MKIDYDYKETISKLRSYSKYLPLALAASIFIVFAILTFFALYPKEDSAHVVEGEQRLQSLDIRFNTKLLGELSATKTPAQLGTAGGRNPFSGF